MNKQRVCKIAIFLAMVLNVELNLLLILRMSYVGASVVTISTEALVFVVLCANIKGLSWSSVSCVVCR